VDTIVSTLVLCTVDDSERALREIARVHRADGQLLFMEHMRPSSRFLASCKDYLLHRRDASSGRYAISTQTRLGVSEGRRWWRTRLLPQGRERGWSIQPPSESKELIDHYGDSQQHQQCNDEGGTHSLIIRPEWQADCQISCEAWFASEACPGANQPIVG
jgi:SAM-dependent methyltransferase